MTKGIVLGIAIMLLGCASGTAEEDDNDEATQPVVIEPEATATIGTAAASMASGATNPLYTPLDDE